MNDFVIYTDSACDIPPELLKEWGVPYSWLTYVFDGDARQYSNYELPFPEFYDKMRKGSVARTSAVNADAFVQGFEPILQDGKDILYIGFSSGLSSTYHAGCIAAQELREKYPERDIRCVDTLGASGGFGLLLYMAVQKKREGGTIEECEKVVLDNRFHLCHWFTVDDLVYLKRGGRISAATAFVGTRSASSPCCTWTTPAISSTCSRSAAAKPLSTRWPTNTASLLLTKPAERCLFLTETAARTPTRSPRSSRSATALPSRRSWSLAR